MLENDLVGQHLVMSGASNWMASFHNRMPVRLAAADFDSWRDGSLGPDVLQPAAEGALRE